LKRCPLVLLAKKALKNPDRLAVDALLDSVNLSLREKEAIKRHEIDKTDLETICNSFESWNKKPPCSYSNILRIKKFGMKKIGAFLMNKNDIKIIDK
jgi:hypothetical protein